MLKEVVMVLRALIWGMETGQREEERRSYQSLGQSGMISTFPIFCRRSGLHLHNSPHTLCFRPVSKLGSVTSLGLCMGCSSVWNGGLSHPNIHLVSLYFYILLHPSQQNIRHSFQSVPTVIYLSLCVLTITFYGFTLGTMTCSRPTWQAVIVCRINCFLIAICEGPGELALFLQLMCYRCYTRTVHNMCRLVSALSKIMQQALFPCFLLGFLSEPTLSST